MAWRRQACSWLAVRALQTSTSWHLFKGSSDSSNALLKLKRGAGNSRVRKRSKRTSGRSRRPPRYSKTTRLWAASKMPWRSPFTCNASFWFRYASWGWKHRNQNQWTPLSKCRQQIAWRSHQGTGTFLTIPTRPKSPLTALERVRLSTWSSFLMWEDFSKMPASSMLRLGSNSVSPNHGSWKQNSF